VVAPLQELLFDPRSIDQTRDERYMPIIHHTSCIMVYLIDKILALEAGELTTVFIIINAGGYEFLHAPP
jgi:hypothetical protein